MANNVQPIWKDYYLYFGTENSPNSYSVQVDDEKIFYGKAWCPPAHDKETYGTKINNICENYLYNDEIDFKGINENGKTIQHTNAIKTFELVNEDRFGLISDAVTFVYDWSYDNTIDYSKTVNMSHPINGKGKEGMYFFQTTCNGTIISTYASKTPTNEYKIVHDCNSKWAIYYLNKYGGWDSYLIEGYVTQKDNLTRNNVYRKFRNNTTEFGTTPYLTEITSTYEIHTGWMNETESDILASNVFQSTRMYLHNLETDEIIPVVVTDADVIYKNKNNSGRKLLNYTINVLASQTKHNKN